jgi:hypothetical protein
MPWRVSLFRAKDAHERPDEEEIMDTAFHYLTLAEICIELANRESISVRRELVDLAERLIDMADEATDACVAERRLH